MGEGAEECVSEQTGYLNLRQGEDRGMSALKQRDGLKTWTNTTLGQNHHRYE